MRTVKNLLQPAEEVLFGTQLAFINAPVFLSWCIPPSNVNPLRLPYAIQLKTLWYAPGAIDAARSFLFEVQTDEGSGFQTVASATLAAGADFFLVPVRPLVRIPAFTPIRVQMSRASGPAGNSASNSSSWYLHVQR